MNSINKVFEKFDFKEIFDYIEIKRKKDKKVAPDDLEYWIGRTKELVLKKANQLESEIQEIVDKEVNELLDALKNAIDQACWDNKEQVYDSMALTDYAYALRILAKHGVVKIKREYGRRVIAEDVKKE